MNLKKEDLKLLTCAVNLFGNKEKDFNVYINTLLLYMFEISNQQSSSNLCNTQNQISIIIKRIAISTDENVV